MRILTVIVLATAIHGLAGAREAGPAARTKSSDAAASAAMELHQEKLRTRGIAGQVQLPIVHHVRNADGTLTTTTGTTTLSIPNPHPDIKVQFVPAPEFAPRPGVPGQPPI